MQTPAPSAALEPAHPAWRAWLAPVVSVVAFALVAVVLHRVLAAHPLAEIVADLRSIPRSALAAAALATVASYLLLTRYDALALRYLGRDVAAPRIALTSFVAYAFGHNLSLASFTGAAIRFRLYSAQGLTAIDVATVVGFCSVTTALGLSVVAGVALLVSAPGATALHLGHPWSQLFGGLLLGWVALYLGWAATARRPFDFGAWQLRPPGVALATSQLLLATLELAVAAAVLWRLLPAESAPGFATFAGVFAMAVVGGLVSQVPGGLGVFETLLLLALPGVPPTQLLGALLAWRGLYYLAPLVVAALLLLSDEALRQRGRLARARQVAGRWVGPLLVPVAPQLVGTLVFVAGAVLLVSGATPAVDARLRALREVMPLPLLELSHLAGSVIGVGLLVLARGLFRRLAAAYHLTFWLLLAGIVASLVKGLDFEEAGFLALVLGTLRGARPGFYRPSSLASQRFTPAWIASIAIIVGLSTWVGLLAYRHVPYSGELWWTFAVHGDAPRMLRASFAVLVASAAFVAAQLLRPARPEPHRPEALDLPKVRAAIAFADTSLANAALAGDKRLLWHPAGDAFVMYQVAGASWIALGDPVGPAARHEELAWSFRELVDRRGGRTVFYQVDARRLPLYLDLGLSLVKLGEEARVPLADFGLEGGARAALRQSHRRAERDGARFELVARADVPALLPRLREISDAWLEEKSTAEKSFSLGAFAERYVAEFPVGVVRCDGAVVAFATLWPSGTPEELSVDLMRFAPDAPRGAMDYLFIELMRWGRGAGYRWFNLGMAPLSGLENRALAPTWHRLGSFLYRHGEAFYNFEGLRRFKDKFDPVWEPRYLASPGGLRLPSVLFDVSTLISGGVRELVTK
jgi:phosphatidylglycerol lysyltransferase